MSAIIAPCYHATMPIMYRKNLGETPLEAIDRLKTEKPELAHETLSYAGRLDPMAEGQLLVLIGDENKQRRAFEKYRKTYECTILVGFATDSYDILGYITSSKEYNIADAEKKIVSIITNLPNDLTLPLPPFSSYRVNGKPLFFYAYHNLIHTISIPSKVMHFENYRILKSEIISLSHLSITIQNNINMVHGSFRQKETLQLWQNALLHSHQTHFLTVQFEVTTSGGSFIRSLIKYIGDCAGIPCLTFTLIRTAIMQPNKPLAITEKQS